MEKYGVEETENTKTATEQADKPRCPVCDKYLRPQAETGVLLCPQCGSAPFEAAQHGSRHQK